ncbi:MAG: NADH-quinone oxidoreductase subunit C [Alistipes sp.]|nr:NADH-quinone oxidoreductase subunit C [Alistipes sp.]MBR6544507.1 NADH-quinone oxidoreductase subunit C [Alistipes sp.]
MKLYHITNNREGAIALSDIPVVEYLDLYNDLKERMSDVRYHIGHYFATEIENGLRFFLILLDDLGSEVLVTSFIPDYYSEGLASLTAVHPQFHPFEREMHELYGIPFDSHPWLKPLRFSYDRRDKNSTMDSYPFYSIEGDELHEVNVGPIHAGIIEPGAFRFICDGEQVLHLEIALGYQHRGVESEMVRTDNRLRQTLIAESIAGDTAIGHTTAYAEIIEKFSGVTVSKELSLERMIALELERIAMHLADTGALATDIGFQLYQVACEALRTVTINSTQAWCGNRFGKSLIRPLGTNHPLTKAKAELIAKNIADVRCRYNELREDILESPTLLARFEQCGLVPKSEMERIGGVGQAARASGLLRDLRFTHPSGYYAEMKHTPILKQEGDVMSRLATRLDEVIQSAEYVEKLLASFSPAKSMPLPNYNSDLKGEALAFSLVEGWRGEICHAAITNSEGRIVKYKVKDPSVHNWLGLAIAVRSEGISDFPINNKSFNLSYCGHDL